MNYRRLRLTLTVMGVVAAYYIALLAFWAFIIQPHPQPPWFWATLFFCATPVIGPPLYVVLVLGPIEFWGWLRESDPEET